VDDVVGVAETLLSGPCIESPRYPKRPLSAMVAGSPTAGRWEFIADGPAASFQVFLDAFDLIG